MKMFEKKNSFKAESLAFALKLWGERSTYGVQSIETALVSNANNSKVFVSNTTTDSLKSQLIGAKICLRPAHCCVWTSHGTAHTKWWSLLLLLFIFWPEHNQHASGKNPPELNVCIFEAATTKKKELEIFSRNCQRHSSAERSAITIHLGWLKLWKSN